MEPLEKETGEEIFWIRMIVIVCFFIAAINVLAALIEIFSYWAFLAGKVDHNQYAELYEHFRKIRQSPYPFLLLTLYNILLWNGVLISAIWLLRFHEWARKVVRFLLSADMMITVTLLLWEAAKGTEKISDPGWYIFLNTLQVGAIIALSHPKLIEITETKSGLRPHPLG